MKMGDNAEQQTDKQGSRGVLSGRTPEGVLLNMADAFDGIRQNMDLSKMIEPDEKRTFRETVDADAYRDASELVLMVGSGAITEDVLESRGFMEKEKMQVIRDIAGDVNLHMQDEAVQNQDLAEKTQRAESVAKALKDKDVSTEEWNNAMDVFLNVTSKVV